MLEDDRTSKESLVRNNKSIEAELQELREQLDAEEESLNFLEEIKHKKDLEINELRKQLDAESEARDKFEQLKNELEREIADGRHILETEKKPELMLKDKPNKQKDNMTTSNQEPKIPLGGLTKLKENVKEQLKNFVSFVKKLKQLKPKKKNKKG